MHGRVSRESRSSAFDDKVTLKTFIFDEALDEMPECKDLPTFTTQVNVVIDGLSRGPSFDYGEPLAEAARSSKPEIFANGANERAARKRLLTIMGKLKGTPGYAAAATELVRENGRTLKAEPYLAHKREIYRRDWEYLDQNPAYE